MLPIGDTLFMSDVKYCDEDGNMFLLQAAPEGGFTSLYSGAMKKLNDPEKWAVPGFAELERFNLTVRDISVSAWNNQNTFGAGTAQQDPKVSHCFQALMVTSPY